jgi:hypothetical protein
MLRCENIYISETDRFGGQFLVPHSDVGCFSGFQNVTSPPGSRQCLVCLQNPSLLVGPAAGAGSIGLVFNGAPAPTLLQAASGKQLRLVGPLECLPPGSLRVLRPLVVLRLYWRVIMARQSEGGRS